MRKPPAQNLRADPARKPEKGADTRSLEGELSAALGLKVSIDCKPGQRGGKLTITYRSLEQLDDLCRRLCERKAIM